MEPIIRDIADTARWVAVFRAEESERSDAIFRDPYARRLAGDRGQQIASAIEFSRANSWSFVARTHLFDAAIERHIAEGFDTILNLGAGLDTRPYRMTLPSSLHWIEADLPATITYKDAMLAGERPACRLDRISVDLADREARVALFERVCDSAWNVLVVTEGLIAYLTEEEVGSLAVDLSRQPSFRRWALDMVSPGLLALARAQMASGTGCWRHAAEVRSRSRGGVLPPLRLAALGVSIASEDRRGPEPTRPGDDGVRVAARARGAEGRGPMVWRVSVREHLVSVVATSICRSACKTRLIRQGGSHEQHGEHW